MICIPMLMVGGIFAETLTVPSILGVTVAGFAVCCLLMVLEVSWEAIWGLTPP